MRRYATLKAEPALLAILCGYELVSIVAGRTPTITNLTMRLGRGARTVVVAAAAGWLAVHLDCVPRGSRSALSDLTGG